MRGVVVVVVVTTHTFKTFPLAAPQPQEDGTCGQFLFTNQCRHGVAVDGHNNDEEKGAQKIILNALFTT